MNEQEEYFLNLLNSCMPLRAQNVLAYTVFEEMGRAAKNLTKAQTLTGFSALNWIDTEGYTETYTPETYKGFTEWVPTHDRYEVVVAQFGSVNGLSSTDVMKAVMKKMFRVVAPQVGRMVVLAPSWLQSSEDMYPLWLEIFPHTVLSLVRSGIYHPIQPIGTPHSLYIFEKDRYGNPIGDPGAWRTFLYRDMLWKPA